MAVVTPRTTTKSMDQTPKGNRKRDVEVAVVTPETPALKKRNHKDSNTKDWGAAMSIFTKFQPGLGHDGVGLYGTLTPASAQRVLQRLDLDGKIHIDIGAADGKMMLGALALGAKRSYGIEIAGDCLVAKFDAMKRQLAAKIDRPLEAVLACNTDICDLPEENVVQWLDHVFQCQEDDDIVVTAVWHGFTIDSKQTLLRAIAKAYPRVTRFSLIGPMRKDFGYPDDVLDFLRSDCGIPADNVLLAHHDHCNLAGGEAQRALTFHLLP